MELIVEESRITSKGQTTVPKAVRQALGLGPGDAIAFRISQDGSVRVERAGGDVSQDPALDGFLDLLAKDIAKRPQALTALTPAFRKRVASLTAGMAVDLDEPTEGEVAL